eukprot:gene9097-29230_t
MMRTLAMLSGMLCCLPTTSAQAPLLGLRGSVDVPSHVEGDSTAGARLRREAHIFLSAYEMSIANFISGDGPTRINADAAAGTANSFNPLGAAAAKHEPAIIFGFADDRRRDRRAAHAAAVPELTMTVKVRGGGGSLDTLHPQDYSAHWITDVFVLDQKGNVVCEHTFAEPEQPLERRGRRAAHAALPKTDELPIHECMDSLPDTVTHVTPYEYCNLHGLWQGPTYSVDFETKAATLFAKVSADDEGPAKYYSPADVVDGSPVKHQAQVQQWRNGFRIAALGADGTGLHPHTFPDHYIEATFATDQHGAVVIFEDMGDVVTTAASPMLIIPDGTTSLTPYDYCNVHGLWAGEKFQTATRATRSVIDVEAVATLGAGGFVYSVAFNHDGSVLASGSSDGTIKLWRMSDNTLITTLRGKTSSVYSIAFNHDGSVLASGSSYRTIKLWRLSDNTLITTLTAHGITVSSVAFNHDGSVLASGLSDDTIQLWRMSDNTLITTLTAHANGVGSVAFNHDGSVLASGSYDNTIKLWRMSDNTLITTLTAHANGVGSVAFNHDGSVLASGSSDNTIKLWRMSDNTFITTLTGHASDVSSVAFNHDGSVLASAGSYYNTIKLWRMSDNTLITTLTEHTESVYSVAFNHDGSILASGSRDGTIKLWRETCTEDCSNHGSCSSVAIYGPAYTCD